MRCPVDDALLEERTHRDLTYHQCTACGGLWFEVTSLRSAAQCAVFHPPPVADDGWTRTPAAEVAGTAKARACPVHPRITLDVLEVLGIEVDQCSACLGVWLDAGEFEGVRAWYGRSLGPPPAEASRSRGGIPDGTAAVAPFGAAEVGGDGFEAAADGIGGAVEVFLEALGGIFSG